MVNTFFFAIKYSSVPSRENSFSFNRKQKTLQILIQVYTQNAKTASTFIEKQNNVSHFAFLVSQINALQ